MESESSSEGSSLSDLKRLLQDLPSPNETASLANRVNNINRCLSRKRNYHFYSATSCIEENDEREEKEEQEHPLLSRNPFGESKTEGARARRRASRNLKSIKDQTMVISQPNQVDTIELKENSNNDGKFVSSSLVECNSLEEASQHLSSFMGEVSRNYTQQCIPLSEEATPTPNPYQYDGAENDSARLQKNASLLRLCQNLSSENSPKSRIELQSLSPASLSNVRPTKFGGYRPPSGVVLHNLSSGSDPDSNYEATSDRVDSSKRNDNLIAVTTPINFTGTTSASPILITKSSANSNICSPSSLSNNTLVDPSTNGEVRNVITSPISKVYFTVAESNARNSNDRCPTPLCSSRKIPRDTSFHRLLGIRRGDCDRKDHFGTSVNRPTFLSARNDIHSCKKQSLESPSSLFEMPLNREIYSNSPGSEASQNTHHKSSSSVNKWSNEIAQRKCQNVFHDREQTTKEYEVSSSNEFLNQSQSNSRSDKDHSVPTMPEYYSSANESLQSPQHILGNSVFENPEVDKLYCSPKDDLRCLEPVASKSFIKCESNNDIKFSLSARVVREETKSVGLASQFESCVSERDSVASTSRDCFTNEFKRNVFSGMTATDNQELPVESTNRNLDNNCQEYVNVPTLLLNSQEMSDSASPASKACSGKHLNTDALVAALSNLSLQQETTNNALTNTSRVFGDGSGTVSRSSINNLITDDKPLKPASIKSDENHSRNDATYRSFLSGRSKIPVKIPSSRNKTVSNRFTESEEETVRSDTISMGSSRQTFRNLPPVAGRLQLDPEMNDNGSTLDASSKEQSERFDLKSATETRQNANSPTEDIHSRDYLTPLQIQEDSDDRYESKEDKQTQTYRADHSCSKQFLIDRSMIEDTIRSSNYPDVQKGDTKSDSGTDSPFSESELIDCSFVTSGRYTKHESLSVERIKCKDSDNLTSQSKSTDYTSSACSRRLENYQERSFRTTHDGDVCESIAERPKPNLIQDEISDGGCQEICIEEPNRLAFEEAPLDSSLEEEKVATNSKAIDSNDKIRFSVERLAVEQFRRNLCAEPAKIMQSRTATFLPEKNYEAPFSGACSSSSSTLRRSYDKRRNSPRFGKKSQDRFPFTISEKTSVTSAKFKVSRRIGSLNEDSVSPDRTYKLNVHPSITRLASSGIEDTPTNIIDYVVYSEREHDKSRSSGIKEFVRRFSTKLKRSRARDKIRPDAKATNVIYENRAYRGDSMADSCSESSLLKEFKVCENPPEKQRAAGSSLNEKSLTNFKEPCRQYDYVSLHNQELKLPDCSRERENIASGTSRDIQDDCKLRNDPYAMFFVKNTVDTPETSNRSLSSEDEEKQDNSGDKKRNRIKFRDSVAATTKRSNENVHKKLIKGRNLKDSKRNGNGDAGCLCLRFYRMFVPASFSSVPKYRSRINHTNNRSSVKKRSNFSLQKKKK